MPGKAFNTIRAFAGFAIAAVVIGAGVLLTWGHSIIGNQVHNELTAQKIYFPLSSSKTITALPAADAAAMSQYSGQQMTTGPQAETYADHLVGVQMQTIAHGLSYAQIINQVSSDRKDATTLEIEAANVFRAQTIRSQLQGVYGFWKIGQIMSFAAIVAFVSAALLLIVSAFGLIRLRRAAAQTGTQPKLAPRAVVETA
jgi:hypothetical protein